MDTLAKNIAEDEEFSNKPDDKTGKLLLVDVHTDTLEEISINAKDKNDLAGRPSSLNKNPSLMKKSFAGSPAPAIVQMRNACRPSFIPSPSGNYCAVFWADTLKYTVYNTFSSDSTTTFSLDNSQKKRLNVIDSGICLSFAWYNNRDQFVIIKPPYMSSVSENKKKGMVKSMLFGGTKDFIQFEKTAIVMKQLQNEVCINMQLDLSSHLLQKELISAEQINDIFSGFLIGINFTLKSETTEKATTDISDLLTANLKSSEVIAHNSEQERLANDWRNRSKTSSDSYFRFFCLLTKSELSQLLEVEHSKNDPRRGKGKTKKTTTEDHAKDVQERGSDELVYSLAVVGPIMRSVSAVSWDYAYGFCSVLIGGTVNIMKLYVTTDEDTKPIGSFSYSSDSKVVSSTTLVLKTLATVELSLPIPTHIGVSSMFWDHKTLFAVTATGVSIINLVNTKLNDVNEPIANVANLSFSSQVLFLLYYDYNS